MKRAGRRERRTTNTANSGMGSRTAFTTTCRHFESRQGNINGVLMETNNGIQECTNTCPISHITNERNVQCTKILKTATRRKKNKKAPRNRRRSRRVFRSGSGESMGRECGMRDVDSRGKCCRWWDEIIRTGGCFKTPLWETPVVFLKRATGQTWGICKSSLGDDIETLILEAYALTDRFPRAIYIRGPSRVEYPQMVWLERSQDPREWMGLWISFYFGRRDANRVVQTQLTKEMGSMRVGRNAARWGSKIHPSMSQIIFIQYWLKRNWCKSPKVSGPSSSTFIPWPAWYNDPQIQPGEETDVMQVEKLWWTAARCPPRPYPRCKKPSCKSEG